MSSITIHKAKLSDLGIIQNLYTEIFKDNLKYDSDTIPNWAKSPIGDKYFSNAITNPENFSLLAKTNNQVVGFIIAVPKVFVFCKSKYLEIEKLGVSVDFQSQGIGKILVEKLVELAKNSGYQRFYVSPYFQNVRAQKFYQKNGFNQIDVGLEKSI